MTMNYNLDGKYLELLLGEGLKSKICQGTLIAFMLLQGVAGVCYAEHLIDQQRSNYQIESSNMGR